MKIRSLNTHSLNKHLLDFSTSTATTIGNRLSAVTNADTFFNIDESYIRSKTTTSGLTPSFSKNSDQLIVAPQSQQQK